MGRANRCSMAATFRRNRSIDSRVVNPKRLGRYIGSKETAMQTTRFERMALARIFVAGWVAFFSVAIGHAQPLYTAPPPPQPPPTFNPSTPYTVPQSPETPVSPGLPSASPGSSAGVSPSVESPPGAVARSHRRPVTATRTSNVAKAQEGPHSPGPHRRNWSRASHTADMEGLWTARRLTVSDSGWGVCGAFESANRCNAEWSPRSHRCGCIVR
jgi:hypothetical protein